MRLLLACILIASLVSPAIAQTADLIKSSNLLGGAIQATGKSTKICRCHCKYTGPSFGNGIGIQSELLYANNKCTEDINFDDDKISDPLECQRQNGIKCEGYLYTYDKLPPVGDQPIIKVCDITDLAQFIDCSIVGVLIQP